MTLNTKGIKQEFLVLFTQDSDQAKVKGTLYCTESILVVNGLLLLVIAKATAF